MASLKPLTVLTFGVLVLSACGGQNTASTEETSVAAATSSAASTTISLTAEPTTEQEQTSAAPSVVATTSSVEKTAQTPSTEPSSSDSPSAVETTVATIAAPGTNCGHPSATNDIDIYVSGGPVSCGEALSVFNDYNAIDKSTLPGVHGLATVQGYQCTTSTTIEFNRDTRSALCTSSSNGGYLEARVTGLRIIPGPVADTSSFDKGSGAVFYPAGTDGSLTAAPHCIANTQGVTCSALTHSGMTTVTMPKDGAATVNVMAGAPQAPGAEQIGAQPLDVGTTINAYGISCQPLDAQSIRCVNKSSGFTVSMSGVVTE